MWQIVLHTKARKSLHKLPVKVQQRIALTLYELKKNPHLGKKMKGRLENEYSIRVWPYRIIYLIKRKQLVVLIVKIQHRQGVYK